MNKLSNDASDEEQDEFLSSGEDWTPKHAEKKRMIRTSQRLRKKPKVSADDASSSENESDVVVKKRKSTSSKKIRNPSRFPQVGMQIISKDFVTGSFLVLNKDVQTGDRNKHPCLWRIDGKALLQKYEAFPDQGKVLHRSTSIYTGWSPLEKDLYSPVTVQVLLHTGQEIIVELNRQTLKNALDSD